MLLLYVALVLVMGSILRKSQCNALQAHDIVFMIIAMIILWNMTSSLNEKIIESMIDGSSGTSGDGSSGTSGTSGDGSGTSGDGSGTSDTSGDASGTSTDGSGNEYKSVTEATLETSSDIEELKSRILKPTYDEILTKINTGLVMYMSTFSYSSFNRTNEWKDISTPGSTKKFTFTKKPHFEVPKGILLRDNSATGPLSMNLGIPNNDDYSIVIYVAFQNNLKDPGENVFFTIFDNQSNDINNGRALELTLQSQNNNNSYFLNMYVAGKSKNNGGRASHDPQSALKFFDEKLHMLTIIKTRQFYKMYLDDNVLAPLITVDTEDSHEIELSNRSIELIPDRKIDADMQVFAVYNRELYINEIREIYQHIADENLKYNNIWTKVINNIQERDDIINQHSACPFVNAENICYQQCKEVSNWNDIGDIAKNTTNICRASVIDYCKSNKDRPICKTLDPDNVRSIFELVNKDEYDLLERCKASGGSNGNAIVNSAIDNIILDKTLRTQGLNSLELAQKILQKYNTTDDSVASTGLKDFTDTVDDGVNLIDYNEIDESITLNGIRKVSTGDTVPNPAVENAVNTANVSPEISLGVSANQNPIADPDAPLTHAEIEKILANAETATEDAENLPNANTGSTYGIGSFLSSVFDPINGFFKSSIKD